MAVKNRAAKGGNKHAGNGMSGENTGSRGKSRFERNAVRLCARRRGLSEEHKNITGDIVRRGCSIYRSDTKNEEQQAEKGNSDLLHGTSPLSSVFWILSHREIAFFDRLRVLSVAILIRGVAALETLRLIFGGKPERV